MQTFRVWATVPKKVEVRSMETFPDGTRRLWLVDGGSFSAKDWR